MIRPNTDPHQPATEFDTSPAALLSKVHEGVTQFQAIEATFDELDEFRQRLAVEDLDIDEVAAFFEAVASDAPDTYFPQVMLDRASRLERKVQKVMTPIGYASMLLAGREVYIQQKAETWSQQPDVQAFVGNAYTFLPPDGSWDQDAKTAAMTADIWLRALWDSNKISGYVKEISPLHRGVISLQGGRVGYVQADEGYVTESYVKGEIRPVLAKVDDSLLASVKVELGIDI